MAIFNSITEDVGARVNSFVERVDLGPVTVLELLLVGTLIYWLYTVLRGTRAIGIIYGFLILGAVWLFTKLFQLELLEFLTLNLLTVLAVAIPVLFQPELRRALERLGRVRFGALKPKRSPQLTKTISHVAEAARILSNNRTGAIIVFKRTTGLVDLSTAGTKLDATVSTALLLNIFYDKSPLHDGAVIIDDNRISAAGVMLPLSEREYSYTLGARHRAAVGLTEQCDAVVLVVSEENGTIALVVGGKITPGLNPEVLSEVLNEFLTRSNPQKVIKTVKEGASKAGRTARAKTRSKANPKAGKGA